MMVMMSFRPSTRRSELPTTIVQLSVRPHSAWSYDDYDKIWTQILANEVNPMTRSKQSSAPVERAKKRRSIYDLVGMAGRPPSAVWLSGYKVHLTWIGSSMRCGKRAGLLGGASRSRGTLESPIG